MSREDYRILSFWSFNEKMEPDEVRRQIRSFKNAGYGGFFIHARAGLELKYMSEDWLNICQIAVEEAKKLGLVVWLYDENGWPSGFADGKVPACGDDFTAKHICFSAVAPSEQSDIIGAYKKSGAVYEYTQNSDKADLYCFVGRLKGYADLLNYDAVSCFIKNTHEAYKTKLGKFFGKEIKGIFTDEPQLVGKYPYTYSLPSLFFNKYGISFEENAWMLNSDSPETYEFKYKLCALFAEMFANNFAKQIDDWCKTNKLIFTGHFSNEDGLCNQTKANFNLLELYKNMQRPGIDFLGRRLTSPVLVKQVSDSAFLHDKSIITSESFGCSGWDVSFDDLSLIAGYQSAFGINSIVTHLSAYSMKGRRKRDYPAFFSYQEPWWDAFFALAENIKITNEFLALGKRNPKTLVIHPATSMWCLSGGTCEFSAESQEISNEFRLLVENLIEIQKDFLIISENDFAELKLKDENLYFNDKCFDTVFVPQSISLNNSTIRILRNFSNGENVIFVNRKPYLCEGKETDAIQDIPALIIQNRKVFFEKYYCSTGKSETTTIISPYGGKIANGLIVSRFFAEDAERLCVVNPSYTDSKNIAIKTLGKKCIWKFESNKEFLASSVFDGRYSYADITLRPKETALFVIKSSDKNEKTDINYSSSVIDDFSVSLTDVNALTIDKCDIYLDGEIFAEDVIAIKETDNLYFAIQQMNKQVKVDLVYTFHCAFKGGIPDDISLVAESENLQSITVNGKELMIDTGDWWIDKSFKKYAIKSIAENAQNIVKLSLTVTPPDKEGAGESFEGYKNKLFYAFEPDNIYITGTFDCVPKCKVFEKPECYTIDGDFEISDFTQKKYGELTKQNLWFYRGNFILEAIIDVKEKCEYTLSFDDSHFTGAKVFVNDEDSGNIIKSPLKLSLNNLVAGENNLKIVIYGSNRNLLGPHHYIKGNPHFLSVLTYTGQKNWTDLINPDVVDENTFIDAYSFVKYSAGTIRIRRKT